MTGGGDGHVSGKGLSKKPLHLAHNHTVIFFIMDIQAINMSTSPHCPHLDRAPSFKIRSLTLTRPQIIFIYLVKAKKRLTLFFYKAFK